MELYNYSNPRALIEGALVTLKLQFFSKVTAVHESCVLQLREIQKHGSSNSENLDCRGAARDLWKKFLKSINSAIEEYFRAVFEIGSANPEFAHPDPACWAECLLEKHIQRMIYYTALPDDIAQLADYLDGDECRGGYGIPIDYQLQRLVRDARVELARRGWKPPETKPTMITPPLPEADFGPQTDLSSTPRQAPKASSAPVGHCKWYKDAGNVWHVSLPPDPDKELCEQDYVGFGYIHVVLREHPNELLAYQVQSLVTTKSSGALPFVGADEGWAKENRPDDGFSDFETTQLILDKTEKSKIKSKLKDIEAGLAKADRNHDQAQILLWKTERENILEFLNRARGKGKRPRRMKTPHGLACDAVRNGIVRAIDKIEKRDAAAGQFLRKNIKTGWKVSYIGPEVDWKLDP
jgi:hypothetical protein